ncbi:RNA methyltransferase [uncultured Brevundimonas sp.]|uniref:TrmH family RNA methyltransferase n=1 Tax=uncultured Brevundimonas sp. TaxID=213418 RepID=UPI0030EE1457|tara:strand:- start:203 stop:1000 length:798 start_codon:yes stop_codon:yes gene_type:complete
MTIIRIEDPADPRIAAFRNIRERDLTGREGLFVAEGEVVLRVLASPESRCRPVSVLLDEKRLEAQRPILERLPEATPVHVAPQAVLDGIAGFHLHRGILALGEKPAPLGLDEFLAGLDPTAVVVAASEIGNHDNMGGIFRNAAAFGAAGVVLDDRCCDSFYRKAIRVSVGAVLRTPTVTGVSGIAMIEGLKRAGFEVIALVPSADEELAAIPRRDRQAIVLGPEGPGLGPELIRRCRPAGIRMSGGFDSLNVGTAGAVALYQLTR